jgi:phospholipid transport system substrate-binding protein
MRYVGLYSLWLWLLAIPVMAADYGAAAKEFTNYIGTSTIEILADKSMDDATKDQRLIQLFDQHTDTPWMAKFVLGRAARDLLANEQSRFSEAYRIYLLNTYLPNLRLYTSETMTVVGAKRLNGTEYMVATVIARAQKEAVHIDYRLWTNDGKTFLMRDMIAEGVSMINTQRADFASIIGQQGIQGLIATLEAKNKYAPPAAAPTYK